MQRKEGFGNWFGAGAAAITIVVAGIGVGSIVGAVASSGREIDSSQPYEDLGLRLLRQQRAADSEPYEDVGLRLLRQQRAADFEPYDDLGLRLLRAAREAADPAE